MWKTGDDSVFIFSSNVLLSGILDSCSFDYLSRDNNLRSFGICIFIFDYCIPLFIIVCAYIFIVKAIVAHEKAMRDQAKKMNVSNLRSNAEANAQSAEMRIAKVAMTNVALWLICWTPYASVVVQVCWRPHLVFRLSLNILLKLRCPLLLFAF